MFYENFERICASRRTSPYAVTTSLGLSKSTAAGWKAKGTIPKQETLDGLAQKLNCKVSDFFKTNEEVEEQQSLNAQLNAEIYKVEQLNRLVEIPIEELDQMLTEPMLLDANVRDFISIYSAATNRQRNQLMSMVYDFEQKVLNG